MSMFGGKGPGYSLTWMNTAVNASSTPVYDTVTKMVEQGDDDLCFTNNMPESYAQKHVFEDDPASVRGSIHGIMTE
ncbi:hypothetical protein Hamer_G002476 [Homarus americanus]|uniref:Uncharacterized protein n=1 Tax=Homarus americanus TaxID=6706 RepID=A0A8J5K2M7_HOMAM|nr:hypothetical protein Hamer_G002476 [Homarus americanus]